MATTAHRILLVDDNPSIHEDFRRILQAADDDPLAASEAELFGGAAPPCDSEASPAAFDLQSALQGQLALEMVEEAVRDGQPFSVAFVDVRMPPGWNGIETIKRLWQVDPDLEVVICTAYADYSWKEIIAELKYTDRFLILKKPFDVIEVRQLATSLTAKAILKRAQRSQVALLEQMVEQRTAELLAAKDAAEQGSRAKSEFLANMSHEIRTPMTAILGFAELLVDDATDQTQLEAAAIIKRNGEHLLGVINDILDLSKIEAGGLHVEHIACSPCQIVAAVLSLMRVRAKAKNLTLRSEYEGPIPETIQSDPTRLRQILINLTANALNFTELGEVRLVARLVDARSPEPKMQFQVVDTGIGMTPQQMAALFKPFTQADASTTRKHGGTGLGLAISQRLAEKLGGEITVQSKAGQGSTFTLTVATGPLNDVAMLEEPRESHPSVDVPQPSQPATRLDARVLLAEDGFDNQRLIAFVLCKAGAEVVVVDNGQIACEHALAAQEAGEPFDVIVMDMQMPVLDGYDATARLRAAGYTSPIIALTAHAMRSDRDKCLQVGCDDYVAKPVDQKRLISVVTQYVTREKSSTAPIPSVG